MVEIDEKGVTVHQSIVGVGVTVRFLSLPPFVRVLMVLIVHVRVLMPNFFVNMFDIHRVIDAPYHSGHDKSDGCQESHRQKCRIQTGPRADPARCGIGDQPAGVRQGKLSGERRRAVLCLGGASQQPPGRGLHHRRSGAKEAP